MIYVLTGLLMAALCCIAALFYALGKARGENKPMEQPLLSDEEREADLRIKQQWANLLEYTGSKQEE